MKTCGNCKYCNPMSICGGDCECKAKSDANITFEVSRDDDIRFYGENDNQPCQNFTEA